MIAPIDHPAAWRAAEIGSLDEIAFDLDRRHLDALEAALARVKRRGAGLDGIEPADFALPEIADEVEELRRLLLHGRGLLLVRGWPVDRLPLEDIAMMYWGLGTRFGRGVTQSARGDRLGYVTNLGEQLAFSRGYRSRRELALHTDSDDIVGLLSIRRGRSGGLSRLASSLAVFNEMVRDHPDLLPPLLEGFFCQVGAGEPDSPARVTAMKVPVFSLVDGDFACCFLRSRMELALATLGRDFTPLERRALDTFEAIANRPDMCLSFMLEPGTASFINNHTTLHARTAFEDFEEAEKKRLLLRLWLRAEPGRRLAEGIARYYGPDGGYEPVAAQ